MRLVRARRISSRAQVPLVVSFVLLVIWLNPNWTDGSNHRVLQFDPQLDLTDAIKKDLCGKHGWAPWKTKKYGPRKVYDLLMVNTELDLLEIRLNATYDFVDHFVIVESPKTFTNLDKPLIIKQNMERFAAYRDKIIYHELEIPKGFHSDRPNPAWDWEDLQRNSMYKQALTGSAAPTNGDVLVVADVDEIIRPETLVLLKACDFPPRLNLNSHFYYYSFQWKHTGDQWKHPQATFERGWRTVLPANLRNSDGGFQPLIKLETADLWSAGWHCSSCFSTITELLTKMASFSHSSMNLPEYRDPKLIADHIREGKDIWERKGEDFVRVEDNQDIPPILLDPQQRERFMYLLNRDGPSAGFTDYHP